MAGRLLTDLMNRSPHDFRPISALWSRNKVDFWAAVATLVGVLVLDVLAGLMIGVLVSLAGLMSRAVRPRIVWLGKDSNSGLFRNRKEDGVDATEGISVVHFGAELFFANVGTFRDSVLDEVDERRPRAVVIDAEAITDIDTTAADEVVKLVDELASRDVTVVFARLQDPARAVLVSGGLEMNDRDFGRVELAVEALTNP
ncbi:MAG: sodium-independent anion transporter [Actinomycetia bacterium]|nr:sodium-independent anion transporter [Actinomycetes bacterium]